MSENEFLLSISDLMDKKLKPIYDRFSLLEMNMMNGFNRLNLIIENEVRPDIKLLAENYLPSGKRYENMYYS